MLTLSTCTEKEFSCDKDGVCFPMNKRCNGMLDSCTDGSDEENCHLVERNKGYNKLIAPKDKNQKNVTVKTILVISEISTIDQINGYFTTTVDLVREWNDHNIHFKNLKQNQINLVSKNDSETLWFPQLIFSNVETLDDIKQSDMVPMLKVVPNQDFQYTKVNKVC